MSLEAIAAIPVASVLRSEGYLLMWVPNVHLPNAFSILSAWRLAYRQTITWCKEECAIGLGGIVASATEHVLVAQKIRPGTNAHGARTRRRRADKNWFVWPRTAHSAKPDEFYALVEHLLPGPYLDVFARVPRPGWTCIGDEIDGLDVTEAIRRLAPAGAVSSA